MKTQKQELKLFEELPESNFEEIQVYKTDFYKWLNSSQVQLPTIALTDNVRTYIESYGFIRGEHRLNSTQHQVLKMILREYFRDLELNAIGC